MKKNFFIILTIWLAGGLSEAFSQHQIQRHIQWLESNQSYLGVQLRDITASEVDNLRLPGESGVYIVRVQEDSPAAQADLQEGDVIIEFGTFAVLSVRQLQRLVSETPAGRQVELVLIRGGQRISKTVTIDERQSSGILAFLRENIWSPMQARRGFTSSHQPRLGIQGERVTEQLGEVLGVPNKEGVLVMEVVEDSPAERAGLQAGDVIISIDGHPVQRVADLTSHLRPGAIELEIIRSKQKHEITVELETRRQGQEPTRL